MRLPTLLAVLLCSCAADQRLPTLDRLQGLTVAELQQRLGKPDAHPSANHVVYLANATGQSASGLPDGCALHITLKDGVVVAAAGVESDLLCRELLRSKGF